MTKGIDFSGLSRSINLGSSGLIVENKDCCSLVCTWQLVIFFFSYLTSRLRIGSYQICKIACCACAGNAGNVFPVTNFKGNRYLAIPACITTRTWCMSGSLSAIGGENAPGTSGACAPCNFTYLARSPHLKGLLFLDVDILNQCCSYGMNMLFHLVKTMRCEYPSANSECSLAKTTIIV